MPDASPRFRPDQATALLRAVFGIFLVNGVMIGAWGGAMPGLRDRVGTDSTGVGVVLVATGLAAILSMQVGGRVADRITPRLPALVSGFVMVIALVVAAFAPNYPTLVASGIVLGLGNGTMDVAMNALGVDAEQAASRAIMSRFHAFFSLGGFVGSAIVILAAKVIGGNGVDPRTAILTTVVLAAPALFALLKFTPQAQGTPETAGSPGQNRGAEQSHGNGQGDAPVTRVPSAIPLQAWVLGIMALFFGFTEGTAIDWASVHVTDVAHVSPSTGAAGLVTVSASMVIIRLLGDALVARFGRVAVVRCGAPVAVLGYAMTTTVHELGLILLGWLLVGFGVGMIAPQIYGIAGHLGGGRVLALVTGFGYTAFLAGPATIGFASSRIGIQHTMVLPLIAGLLLTALTFTSALREPDVAPS